MRLSIQSEFIKQMGHSDGKINVISYQHGKSTCYNHYLKTFATLQTYYGFLLSAIPSILITLTMKDHKILRYIKNYNTSPFKTFYNELA